MKKTMLGEVDSILAGVSGDFDSLVGKAVSWGQDLINNFAAGLKAGAQTGLNDLTIGQPLSMSGGAAGWSGNMNVNVYATATQSAEEVANYVERKIINEFTRRKMVSA